MPLSTGAAAADQTVPRTADQSQAAIDGGRRTEGGEDEGGKKRKLSANKEGEAAEGEVRRNFFSTLPMDMLYQICSHLDPGTLLAIAQTSKSMRSTLFRRSAAIVWRAARRNIGLDILSGKLDEPTYAYLLYGKACQVCGTTTETTASFDLQVRACAKCLETKSAPLVFAASTAMLPLDALRVQAVSHKGKRTVGRKPFYWMPAVVATSAILHEIDPVAARTDRRKAHPSQAALDFKRDFDIYASAVKTDAKVFSECVKRAAQRTMQDEREFRLFRIQQLRFRLMAEGFTKKDTFSIPNCFKDSTTPVDDVYWENIKDRLIRAVQEAHDARLKGERAERKRALFVLYKNLYSATPPAEQTFFPSPQAFWRLPSVQALWFPEDAVSDPASWSSATPAIRLDLQRQARVDKIRYFHRLARALTVADVALPSYITDLIAAEPSAFVDMNDETEAVAPLHDQLTDQQLHELLYSPLAVFRCGNCLHHFLIPNLGTHWQQRHAQNSSTATLEVDNMIKPVGAHYLRLLDRFLHRLGLSSLATTIDFLDKLPAGFEVRFNSPDGRLCQGLNWSGLVSHAYSYSESVYALLYIDPTLVDKKKRAKTRREGGSKLPTHVSTSGGTSG
ncbi:hypothetical protein NBRC10512v2_002743 [Rhodotorula toruloides]|uniref:F-box domain contaning protein n=1 Tax=Rhodotorula toruloides (strain NP11) TaxID=1130832 RepID=M7XQN7_RHOT1|nr:F-box domain contaning protein [Rhodotorula toruloides NP11]EMS22528.1 F-box domain contaning protein [Rhodotorula toruloides NP11]